MRVLVLLALTFLGCAKTRLPAPGEPDGDELVVTYYYLSF